MSHQGKLPAAPSACMTAHLHHPPAALHAWVGLQGLSPSPRCCPQPLRKLWAYPAPYTAAASPSGTRWFGWCEQGEVSSPPHHLQPLYEVFLPENLFEAIFFISGVTETIFVSLGIGNKEISTCACPLSLLLWPFLLWLKVVFQVFSNFSLSLFFLSYLLSSGFPQCSLSCPFFL